MHKDTIYFNDNFFKDLYSKNINVINLETQVNALYRLSKYKEKGFKVSKELIDRIFNYNRKNPERLFKEWDGYDGRFINSFDVKRACRLLGITRICKLKRIG